MAKTGVGKTGERQRNSRFNSVRERIEKRRLGESMGDFTLGRVGLFPSGPANLNDVPEADIGSVFWRTMHFDVGQAQSDVVKAEIG